MKSALLAGLISINLLLPTHGHAQQPEHNRGKKKSQPSKNVHTSRIIPLGVIPNVSDIKFRWTPSAKFSNKAAVSNRGGDITHYIGVNKDGRGFKSTMKSVTVPDPFKRGTSKGDVKMPRKGK